HSSDGPTLSTSTSVTERFCPSGVSHERVRSRPTTMARVPFTSDSAAFSACCRHTLHRMNDVSPSFHSLVTWSRNRRLIAPVNDATGVPDGVYRSSGSSVRLPTRMTWLPWAIKPPSVGETRGKHVLPWTPRYALAKNLATDADKRRSPRGS